MSSVLYILVLSTILGANSLFSASGDYERPVNAVDSEESISVYRRLDELGLKYDYFFTIEESWKDKEPVNHLESYEVQRQQEGRDIWRELNSLQKLVPGFTYKQDKANPKIIHIIEGDLAQQREYVLDRKIPSLNFAGTVFHLVEAIAKQGFNVSAKSGMTYSDAAMADFKTEVKIEAKNLTVRNALSDYIPLKGRSHKILWIARTKLGSQETSYIQFRLSNDPKP